MITLTCPSCAHKFPVFLLESDGGCICGMVFDLKPLRGSGVGWVVKWTPDPATPSAGTPAEDELHVVVP